MVEHLNKQDLVESIGQWGYTFKEFFGVPVKVLMLSPLSPKWARSFWQSFFCTCHLPSPKEESQLIMNWNVLEMWLIYAFLVTHSFFGYLFQRQKGNISMAVEMKRQPQLLWRWGLRISLCHTVDNMNGKQFIAFFYISLPSKRSKIHIHLFVILFSIFYREAVLMKFQKYGNLNKTGTMKTPDDLPIWMRERPKLFNFQELQPTWFLRMYTHGLT